MKEIYEIRSDMDQNEQILRFINGELHWIDGAVVKKWPLHELKRLKVHHYVGTVALSALFADESEIVLLRGSLGNGWLYQDFAQRLTICSQALRQKLAN